MGPREQREKRGSEGEGANKSWCREQNQKGRGTGTGTGTGIHTGENVPDGLTTSAS